MDVRPQTYNASFYILGSTETHNGTLSGINVSLRSNLTNDVWCSETIPFSPGNNISTFAYQQYSTQLVNTATAPNSNNTLAITFDASEVAGNIYYISLVSLFPETYKNRPNGLRRDLGQIIEDMGTRFLRFPGGNNIEGQSVFTRWKWQETIGPLIDRPGRIGDWGYYNTDGLGLLEFLEWTEDMNIERVLAIYGGYSLDGTSYPESEMDAIVQDALNELEYCMGDTSTTYGALRAQHGHPEPFPISYIELGNEDWFSSTVRSPGRYSPFLCPYRSAKFRMVLKVGFPASSPPFCEACMRQADSSPSIRTASPSSTMASRKPTRTLA
jgi:alpha-N-arabinofuranosidase